MKKVFGLPEEELVKLEPLEIFRMLATVAMLVFDEKMLMSVVRDWAPYTAARKTDLATLTVEQMRRVLAAAKSEASRRGVVVDIAERRAAGTV